MRVEDSRKNCSICKSDSEKRGEITAFLSLIFVLLVSFILAMTESAWIQTTKNQKRLDVDRAIFSTFGEYEKELLEEYEVFALDGAYHTGDFDENKILGRMAYHGSMGIEQEVLEIQLLTDADGQAFREQVLAFMEEKTGISLIRDLTGMAAEWETQEIKGQELSAELDSVLESDSSLLPEEATGLVQAKGGSILALALPKGFVLSGKNINLREQTSVRNLNMGRGRFPFRTAADGIESKLMFEQYLVDHFGMAVSKENQEPENRNLDYELEYILCGKSSDVENLKQVINRLLAYRFAGNYLYLMTNVSLQEQATAMALAIATVLLNPAAEEVIKQILLVLWAFGESVMDIRSLLSGKRIPLLKDESSWQLQLSELFRLGTADEVLDGKDTENGLGYAEYLQILLFLKEDSELTMRTLDRIEQNLRIEQGLDQFKADNCVTKLKVQNMVEIRSGVTYSFPAYFGYL